MTDDAKLSAALSGLSAEDAKLARALAADGQAHLFAAWPPSPEDDDRKRALLAQAPPQTGLDLHA